MNRVLAQKVVPNYIFITMVNCHHKFNRKGNPLNGQILLLDLNKMITFNSYF